MYRDDLLLHRCSTDVIIESVILTHPGYLLVVFLDLTSSL